MPPISPRGHKPTTIRKGVIDEDDKTGIFTILKETKKEIIDQINELYREGDPELFFQYAKKVAKFNRYNPQFYNLMNIFDRNLPIRPHKKPEIVSSHSESSLTSSFAPDINNQKFTKDDLMYLKRIFNEDKKVSNKYRYDLLKKQEYLEDLERELVIIMDKQVDEAGLQRIQTLNAKLQFVSEKHNEALMFQETLKYMLDRDNRIIIHKKDYIASLKIKRQKINQYIKDIKQQTSYNNEFTKDHINQRFMIETKFKVYIQNILREYEENVKVKEI